MTPHVLSSSPEEYFFEEEGCYITELSNSDHDPDVSVARARIEKGVTTRWHSLAGTTERYLILSGQGRVEVGSMAPKPVSPGDTVLIPPECRQRITNSGTEDLVFLAVCTPRFKPENYRREGSSAPILTKNP
jgi:mannose-6-phosphate isomerase-like protein (cupin superfamily)